MLAFFYQRQEFCQGFFQVTIQRQGYANILINFRLVNIHLDNGLGSCVTISIAGYPVTQTAACNDKHVCVGNSKVAIHMTMHAGQSNCTFITAGIHTQAHQRANYGQICPARQFNQLFFHAACNCAAANHQYRSFCFVQSSSSFFNNPLIGLQNFR